MLSRRRETYWRGSSLLLHGLFVTKMACWHVQSSRVVLVLFNHSYWKILAQIHSNGLFCIPKCQNINTCVYCYCTPVTAQVWCQTGSSCELNHHLSLYLCLCWWRWNLSWRFFNKTSVEFTESSRNPRLFRKITSHNYWWQESPF